MTADQIEQELAKTYSKEQLVEQLHKVSGEYLKNPSKANNFSMMIIAKVLLRKMIHQHHGREKAEAIMDDMEKIYTSIKTPANKN